MTLLQRLRIFSLQCGEGGSTRKIVDEAIEHIQQLELDAAGHAEALSKIDKINQQVCAQRDAALETVEAFSEARDAALGHAQILSHQLKNLPGPATYLDFLEAIADIGYIAGTVRFHSGDSRADISSYIEWAKEFTDLHKETNWNEAEPGYMELIWDFAKKKMWEVQRPKHLAAITNHGQPITDLERSKGRSENYWSLPLDEQWAEDKALGLLDWDGKPDPAPAMTADQAKALGYEVIEVSAFEVGLIKNGKGVRTWFAQDFDGKIPPLDHPEVLKAIQITEGKPW